MNIIFLYLLITIIVAVIIHGYIKKEKQDEIISEEILARNIGAENFTTNNQSESGNNVTIKMSRGELASQAEMLANQISQISDIIDKVNNENSRERLTSANIARINNIYKNVMKHIKIDNILGKEDRLFRNEQYFQDKEIEKQAQQLQELKTQLELITNADPKYGIKSIRNPISGINLNVHNVSPVYDNKQYSTVDNFGFGQVRTMDECILKCKNTDDCKGVTYDTNLRLCKGTNVVNPNFSTDERTYSNLKSWEKDNGSLIYLNGKCLSYYQDVLLVKKDSVIKSWLDCNNLPIGKINYINDIGNSNNINSNTNKQKYLDSLMSSDIKMVKPTYVFFNHKKGTDTITKTHNEQQINDILSKLNNDVVNGIRMPVDENIRASIINKLKTQPGGLIGNYRFVDINSGYDLNRCSTKNKNQVFDITKIDKLDNYNNMIRDKNDIHKGYDYKSVYEQYEIDISNNSTDKAKECSDKCKGTHRLTCKTTNFDINKDLPNSEPCIANPNINYTMSNPSKEKCKDMCKNDLDCMGIKYIDNLGDEKCIGSRFEGNLIRASNDNNYGWNKYTKNELKTLDYTPTPFYVVTSKNNLTSNKKECLTVDGDNVSLMPCDLGLNQRWNISKKHLSC